MLNFCLWTTDKIIIVMKKFFLMAALLLGISSFSFAQDINWGVRASLGFGHAVGSIKSDDFKYPGQKYGAKVGFSIGGIADIKISENFYLQPGLYYINKGYSSSFKEDEYKYTQTTNLHYLEIPVLASYRHSINNDIELQGNFGPYIAVGLGGKIKWSEKEDNEELVIDFDSKCEMSLSACDKITEDGFEEFSIADTIAGKVESEVSEKMESYTKKLTDEFNAKYDEMKDSFEELDRNYKAAMEELSAFRAADSVRKEKEHKDAIDTVVNDFAKKLGRVPEFLIYKARLDYSKTVDEVQKELTLMAGKSVMDNQTKANFAYTPVSTTLSNKNQTKDSSDRYGNLLDKFMK